jgi:hypothetical protein
LLSCFILFVFIIKLLLQENVAFIKSHIIWLVLFTVLAIFTLIPIPEILLAILSPKTLKLFKEFRIEPSGIYTLSIYPEATYTMILQLVSFLAVFWVSANYIDSPNKFRRIIWSIFVAGSIYTLYGIIQKFYASKGNFSTFTNRNHFAAYLEMIVPLVLGYALTKSSKPARYMLIFIASIMGLAIFLSQSRAGSVCFILSMLIFLTLLRIKMPSKNGAGAVIVFMLILSIFITAIGVGDVTKRLQTLSDPLKAIGGRLDVLKDIPSLISDFTFFGTGLGTFIEIFKKYKTFSGEWIYRFSHNEPVQLLVESGFFGFIVIALFLFFYLKDVLLIWFKRHNPYVIYLGLGCLSGATSILLHSLFEFMFHVPANTLLFFIIMALLFRVVYYKDGRDKLPLREVEINISPAVKWGTIIVLCTSFLFIGMILLKRYEAEATFQRVKQVKIPETGIEALLEYRKLIRAMDSSIYLNPLNSSYPAQKANFLYELAVNPSTKDILSGVEEFQNPQLVLASAEKLYKSALRINPINAEYYFGLAKIYSFNGEYELEGEVLLKTGILNPLDKRITR